LCGIYNMHALLASGLALLFLACVVFALAIFVWGFVGWFRESASDAESRRLMKTSFYFILTSVVLCLVIVFFFGISALWPF